MSEPVDTDGGALAANFTSRGMLGAPIDLETGELGVAADRDALPQTPRLRHHPATGAAIAGRQLPYWAETLALAEAAHRAFPSVSRVGWDLAITTNGPLLIEGNDDMGVESLQTVHDRPLTDFLTF